MTDPEPVSPPPMDEKGTFRIEVLSCSFDNSKMHTMFDGAYNETMSLPLYVRNRIVRSDWIETDNGMAAATLEKGNIDSTLDLAHFWPGTQSNPSDKPLTSVRHIVGWEIPDASSGESGATDQVDYVADEVQEGEDDNDDGDDDDTIDVRLVTFTYPVPGQKQAATSSDSKKEVGGGKAKKRGGSKGGAKGTEKASGDSTLSFAHSLVRLPVIQIPRVRPSPHVLQRSQPFDLNEATLTELAGSDAIVELWTGEERAPGEEGSGDKLVGFGKISRMVRKWIELWPEPFEEIISLEGPGCGETKPNLIVRIVPDQALLNYLLGGRMLTLNSPSLWRMPAHWLWNVDPPVSENEEVEVDGGGKGGKKKKPPAAKKGNAGGNSGSASFPCANSQFVMGVSLLLSSSDDDEAAAAGAAATTSPPPRSVVYLHGGKVHPTSRRQCSEASGFIGKATLQDGDDDESGPTGPVVEVCTVPQSPTMDACDCTLVSWEENQQADLFVSSTTVERWKDSSDKNKKCTLSLQVEVARLMDGYSDSVNRKKLDMVRLSDALRAADAGGLAAGSGTVEIFTSTIPLSSDLFAGLISHEANNVSLEKFQHFSSDQKSWLSLTDETLATDKRDNETRLKIRYVTEERKRRMKENEDDDIDDSDLPSLDDIVVMPPSIDLNSQKSPFATLFAPYNAVVIPGVPISPASTPLNAAMKISISKPTFQSTSMSPDNKPNSSMTGSVQWKKYNRTHAAKREKTLRDSASAESRAIVALSIEMERLEKMMCTAVQGGTSTSKVSLSTADYEAFRARMKVQMLTILKVQLGQNKEVDRDHMLSMTTKSSSGASSGNPLESAPTKICATKQELAAAIAHTKRTARGLVDNVFGRRAGAGSGGSIISRKIEAERRASNKQVLTNGWQSLVENVPGRAVQSYTNQLQRMETRVVASSMEEKRITGSELWHALAQARINTSDLEGALVCLNAALEIDRDHVNTLMLRSCVDAELQLLSEDGGNTITMDSLAFSERAVSNVANKMTRATLAGLCRLANNDTKCLQLLFGSTTSENSESPWNAPNASSPRPQVVVDQLHVAARYAIDAKLQRLAAALLDAARSEERHEDASMSDVYPLARAVRTSAYRGGGSENPIIAKVRDAQGRHVGLVATWYALRASMSIRATEHDAMKAQRLERFAKGGSGGGSKSKKKQNKDITMTHALADKKAAEGASEAANRARYEMSGSTLDVQRELEHVLCSSSSGGSGSSGSMDPSSQQQTAMKCTTAEGRVRYALAEFRADNEDDTVHDTLFQMIDSGNRTGVLWSRDRASTYMLAWQALRNPNRESSLARKMFSFIVRDFPQLAGAWCGLGLCQMYDNELDLAQASLERACTLDSIDIRNWLAAGCNALCRGDAGVSDAEQCARWISDLGHTTKTTEESPVLLVHTLMQDFLDGLQQFEKTKSSALVARHLKSSSSQQSEGAAERRPNTVPVGF